MELIPEFRTDPKKVNNYGELDVGIDKMAC